jgi:CYTH domain-containing protein
MTSPEIERKYLLSTLPPRDILGAGVEIRQGYLDTADPEIRVRQRGPDFFLTVKSGEGVRRQECEVQIPAATFDKMWPLTEGARIVKTRYAVWHGDARWEIDEFRGALAGLYLAEVELASPSQTVTPPAFLSIAQDVSDDSRYRNKNLATRGRPGSKSGDGGQTQEPGPSRAE